MQNYFQSKLAQEKQDSAQKREQYKVRQSEKHSQKLFQLAASSISRIENYQLTSPSINHSGTIPLLLPTQHNFRDRDRAKEMSQLDLYIRTYVPDKDRAAQQQIEFLESHLERGAYDSNPPHRDLKKEGEPMRFGNDRCEANRVAKTITDLSQVVDYSESSLKMLYFPDWKPVHREKWVDKKPFNQYARGMRQMNTTRLPKEDQTYIDGFEVMGNLDRKRNKDLEIKGPPFNPVICKDPQGKALMISQSIRTLKQDDSLGFGDVSQYSINDKLKHYKQALVKTKSVDHLVPIIHSNNFQSIELKNLRPARYDKRYQKSAVQYEQQLAREEMRGTKGSNNLTASPILNPKMVGTLKKIPEDPYQTQSQFATTQKLDTKRSVNKEKTHTSIEELASEYPYHQLEDSEVQTIVRKYFS